MTALSQYFGRVVFTAASAVFLTAAAIGASPGWQALSDGIAHTEAGAYAKAVDDFSKAILSGDLSKTNLVRATYNRGVAYDGLGRNEDALTAYNAALVLKPDFSPALINRGNLYRRLGRLSEAQQDYWAALAIAGAATEYAYYGLGMIAQSQNNPDIARGYYRHALMVAPDFDAPRQALQQLGETAASADPPPANPPPANRASENMQHIEAVPALRLGIAERAGGHRVQRTSPPESEEPTVAEPSEKGQYWAQIGSYPDRAGAEADWRRLDKKSGGLLAGYKPTVVSADLPTKGRVFRLRIAGPGREQAQRLCQTLIDRGLDCLPVKD